MFECMVRSFEEAGMPYCILAGYDNYPDRISSDVDFMVPSYWMERLPALIATVSVRCDAQLVQCIRHETTATYFVVARLHGDGVSYLQPDASADYRRRGRLWLRADEIVSRRRRHHRGFWVPSAADAFAYYLIKKIDKGALDSSQARQLSARYEEDPRGCDEILRTLLPADAARMIEHAVHSADWTAVISSLPALKPALHRRAAREPLRKCVRNVWAELCRIVGRVLRPTGLSVAFLGPDGSGKSTLVAKVSVELNQTFRRVQYQHLRPGLFSRDRNGAVVIAADPHGKPLRGAIGSVARLLLFWLEFLLGWPFWLFPRRVRSTLVIFDRYFHDILPDPRRYRYGASPAVIRILGRFVPQPDLAFILDAPPELLQTRKQEVTLMEGRRQRGAYLEVAKEFRRARIVDVSRPLDQVVACILRDILDHLQQRAAARLDLTPRPMEELRMREP